MDAVWFQEGPEEYDEHVEGKASCAAKRVAGGEQGRRGECHLGRRALGVDRGVADLLDHGRIGCLVAHQAHVSLI